MFKRSIGTFFVILLFFGGFILLTDFYESAISQVEMLLIVVLTALSGMGVYFAFTGSGRYEQDKTL